jgi:glutathione S-transferase
MMSEGNAYARFRRALRTRSVPAIRMAAGELPQICLADALDVCLVFLECEPEVYPRAAARWASRLALERALSLVESQLAQAALAALALRQSRQTGAEVLLELCARHDVRGAERVLQGWFGDHEGTPG